MHRLTGVAAGLGLALAVHAGPAFAQSDSLPGSWVELGVAVGSGRGPCLSHCAPSTAFMGLRAAYGVHLRPQIALAGVADFGSEVDFEAIAKYRIFSGVAELVNPSTPGFRLRPGLGWGRVHANDYRIGSGFFGRLGVALEMPPGTSVSLLLTLDHFRAFTGEIHERATFSSPARRGPFNFSVTLVGVSLRLGDERPGR